MPRKRKSNSSEWKDYKGNKLKDAGKAYKTRKRKSKEEKTASDFISNNIVKKRSI